MNLTACPKCKTMTIKHEKYGAVCINCRDMKECKRCHNRRDLYDFSRKNKSVCKYCLNAEKEVVNVKLVDAKKKADRLFYLNEMKDINNMFHGIDNL